MLGGKAGQCLDELKDAALARLQLAQRVVVHEQVDQLFLLGQLVDPVDVLVGREGIGCPLGVAETERDVVAQLAVLQQQLELGSRSTAVQEVGRAPAQHVLGIGGDGGFEAHGIDHRGHVVVINQLGVAEHLGLLAEELVDLGIVSLDLGHKLVGVVERRQAVGIGLAQELDAAGSGQFLHRVDELGYILFQLLQRGAADGEGHFELLAVFLDHVEQHLVGGQIRPLCDARDDVIVGKVIIVVVVVADVEETVMFQAERLMNLEIKTNRFHIFWFLVFSSCF